jgi:hypothetical protein
MFLIWKRFDLRRPCFRVQRLCVERDLAGGECRPLVRLGKVDNRSRWNQFVPDPPTLVRNPKSHQRPLSLRKLSMTSCKLLAVRFERSLCSIRAFAS